MKHYSNAEPRCSMCNSTSPIDYGLMCNSCREQDAEIERMFSDDVTPSDRPPLPLRLVGG